MGCRVFRICRQQFLVVFAGLGEIAGFQIQAAKGRLNVGVVRRGFGEIFVSFDGLRIIFRHLSPNCRDHVLFRLRQVLTQGDGFLGGLFSLAVITQAGVSLCQLGKGEREGRIFLGGGFEFFLCLNILSVALETESLVVIAQSSHGLTCGLE